MKVIHILPSFVVSERLRERFSRNACFIALPKMYAVSASYLFCCRVYVLLISGHAVGYHPLTKWTRFLKFYLPLSHWITRYWDLLQCEREYLKKLIKYLKIIVKIFIVKSYYFTSNHLSLEPFFTALMTSAKRRASNYFLESVTLWGNFSHYCI